MDGRNAIVSFWNGLFSGAKMSVSGNGVKSNRWKVVGKDSGRGYGYSVPFKCPVFGGYLSSVKKAAPWLLECQTVRDMFYLYYGSYMIYGNSFKKPFKKHPPHNLPEHHA